MADKTIQLLTATISTIGAAAALVAATVAVGNATRLAELTGRVDAIPSGLEAHMNASGISGIHGGGAELAVALTEFGRIQAEFERSGAELTEAMADFEQRLAAAESGQPDTTAINPFNR